MTKAQDKKPKTKAHHSTIIDNMYVFHQMEIQDVIKFQNAFCSENREYWQNYYPRPIVINHDYRINYQYIITLYQHLFYFLMI